MPIATPRQRENLAVAYGASATHASLHTADPGTTGASVVAALARQPLTWAPGTVDGTVTASATFTVPANTNVTHAGLWDALTGGNFLDKGAAVYNSQPTDGQMVVNFTFNQQ